MLNLIFKYFSRNNTIPKTLIAVKEENKTLIYFFFKHLYSNYSFCLYFLISLFLLVCTNKRIEGQTIPKLLENSNTYLIKGVSEIKQKNYQEAMISFKKAIELDTLNFQAFVERAKLKIILEDYKSAIADCDQAKRIKKDYAEIYKTKALAYESLGDIHNAIVEYKQAIEYENDIVEAKHYYKLGMLLLQIEKIDEACKNLSKAGELGFMKAYDLIKSNCNNQSNKSKKGMSNGDKIKEPEIEDHVFVHEYITLSKDPQAERAELIKQRRRFEPLKETPTRVTLDVPREALRKEFPDEIYEPGKRYEPMLAERQKGIEQAWNALISGIGAGGLRLIGAGATEWGNRKERKLNRSFPIFREDRDKVFDFSDPGWYFEGIRETLASAFQLAPLFMIAYHFFKVMPHNPLNLLDTKTVLGFFSIVLGFVIAYFGGRKREIGFKWAFVFFMLSPVIGLIITMLSRKN